MRLLFVTMLLASSANAAGPLCSKYCNPEASKPCGNACIPKGSICHKAWTTACSGERPKASGVSFDNPKHVDVAPSKK